jgi:hypothetical protein
VIINSHLHELAVDDALSALSTLSADSAKEKWGRLPAHVKTAVTKVRALSVALVTLRGAAQWLTTEARFWLVVSRRDWQAVKFFADDPLRQQLKANQALDALSSLAMMVASSAGLSTNFYGFMV